MVWCTGPEFPSTASSPNAEHWCLETSTVIILHLPNTQKVQVICLSKLTFETITSNRKRSIRFPCYHLLFRILGLQSLWARVSATADYQVWILRVAQTVGETHRQHSCLNTSPASPHPRAPPLPPGTWPGEEPSRKTGQDYKQPFSDAGTVITAWKSLEPVLSSGASSDSGVPAPSVEEFRTDSNRSVGLISLKAS